MTNNAEDDKNVMVVLSRRALVALVVLPLLIGLITVGAILHDASARRVARDEAIKISDAKICQRIDKVYAQLRTVALRSNKSLPGITYFKNHPEELKAALEQNADVVRAFRHQDCAALPSITNLPGKTTP